MVGIGIGIDLGGGSAYPSPRSGRRNATGSSTGIATVLALSGGVIARSVGLSQGLGVVNGVSDATPGEATGGSEGLATVLGIASSLNSSTGLAEGESEALGIPEGGGPIEATGSSEGESEALGIGYSLNFTTGSSTASATTLAVGSPLANTTGSSTGSATSASTGGPLANGTGVSDGVAEVDGVADEEVDVGDRYWVGGTATWDATAGSKWALSSGGTGGASVPTSAENVKFDSNSSGTCTLSSSSVCKDIDCTGFTGTISHPVSTDLNVYGSLKFDSGMTYTIASGTSAINFNATTTGHTVDCGGKNLGNVFFLGNGGGWTLAAQLLVSSNTITITRGTFDTANYNIFAGSISSNNTNVRSISFGSSTLTLTGQSPLIFAVATNLTLDAGTSTLNTTNNNSVTLNLPSIGLTLYDWIVGSRGTTTTISGTGNSFRNITMTLTSSSPASELILAGNLTVTGTLSVSGNSEVKRIIIRSSALHTPRTITAAAISFAHVDLRDITGAGAANWDISAITGLSGDCGGNSGITFTTPSTSYWVGGTGTWSTNNEWSATSGGTGGNHRVPLPQDTAIFDANSFSTTGLSVDMQTTQSLRYPSIDASAATNNPTFTRGGSVVEFYGSLIFPATSTVTNTGTTYLFIGRGTHYIDLGDSPAVSALTVDCGTGSYTFNRGFTGTVGTFNSGTLDLNDYNFSFNTFIASTSSTKTLSMGSGTLTISGVGTSLNISASGLTLNAETSTIDVTNVASNTKTLTLGGLTYYNLIIRGGASAGPVNIQGSNTFNNLTFDPASQIAIQASVTQTVTGTFSAVGTSGNVITLTHASGTRTISKASGTVTLDYCNISRVAFTGGATWQASNSTNGGNNSGISFI